MNKLLTLIRGAALATGFLACTNVKANTISVDFVNTTPSGSNTSFNYNAITANSDLVAGDYFEVTDFGGFVSASAIAGFTTSFPATGPGFGPAASGNPDSGAINNVRYTWIGGGGIGTDAFASIFPFSLLSTVSTTVAESYSSIDHVFVAGTGFGGGSTAGGALTVAALPPPPPSVPEGGSALALLGIGLIGVASLRRKLKKA